MKRGVGTESNLEKGGQETENSVVAPRSLNSCSMGRFSLLGEL